MTSIKLFRREKNTVRVIASGHTGYSESGSDIVCAAISTILETTLLGLKQVLRVNVEEKRDEGKGYLEFWLPNPDEAKLREVQILFDTMLVGLADLEKQYGRFIKLEVKS